MTKAKETKPKAKVKSEIDENFVAEQVRQIIEKLGVSATAEVSKQEDEQVPSFLVDIASEDSSLLIGKYGSNLESLQFILAVRLKTLTGDDNFEIFVDIDGWRKQKEEKLIKMALSIAEDVQRNGKPEPLYNLKASERRIIHMALSDHDQVETESSGEGEDRYLIIKPKA